MASREAPTRAAVLWDRSRESTRTIHDALPLLRVCGSVQIIVVETKPGTGCELDTQSLSIHLAHHGIDVEQDVMKVPEHAAFTRQIASGGHDLLVIGGSSAPAWVKILFGDTTQSILSSSIIPVFVSQ
jgi:nucleotide-binding universal stress UspA family protein